MSALQLFKQNFETSKLEPLGWITDAQLQFLIDNLEEEFVEDTDYYNDRAAIEFLKEQGADPELLQLLERALVNVGEEEGVDIVYRR